MTVKIYTKLGCGSCLLAKNYMDSGGMKYEEIDLDKDEKEKKRVIELGVRSLPFIEAEDGRHVTGYEPAEILKLFK